MINALCIDVEPWYSAELVRKYLPETRGDGDDGVVESVTPILTLLDRYKIRATFAVLGIVAERHPQLVRDIFHREHEIASHAYSHRMLQDLGQEAFEAEIEKSVRLLTSITGESPIGFRAPSLSLNNATRWALPILLKHGFKWDASICPVKTFLYGAPGAPLHPYRPSLHDVTREDIDGQLVELPMTTLGLGVRFPIAGGFYLRLSSIWLTRYAIRRVNRTRPANVYIHPWETYPGTPRLRNMPLFHRFITYYGINSVLDKLEKVLQEFEFRPVREVLGIV